MSENAEILAPSSDTSTATKPAAGGKAVAVRPATMHRPDYTSRYDESAWEVRVYLPGVAKSDTQITVENEILEIRAQRRLSVPEGWRPLASYPEAKHYRLRLDIGPEVDAGGVTATQSDGVLELRLPLREEVKPRRIEIQ
jgi:HSP20 family protein